MVHVRNNFETKKLINAVLKRIIFLSVCLLTIEMRLNLANSEPNMPFFTSGHLRFLGVISVPFFPKQKGKNKTYEHLFHTANANNRDIILNFRS